MLLTLDSIVKVDVAIASAATVSSQRFDVGLLVSSETAGADGPSANVRAKTYTALSEVLSDYANTTQTYKLAEKYFSASPTPRALVIGYAASGETPEATISAIRDVTTDWYGIIWVGNGTDAVANNTLYAIEAYLEEIDSGMLFFNVSGTVSTIVAAEPLSRLTSDRAYRAVPVFTATKEEVGAVMGTAMGCANAYSEQTWQMCYRSINGMTPNTSLTEAEITALRGVNCNVYVTRATDMNLFERGATASGLRIDEVISMDRIAEEIRDSIVALMVNNKLPQNDNTSTRFMAAINAVLERYASIGVIDSGIWRGDAIGELNAGDVLERGYVVYADSFDNQAYEDRVARKGMPITVGLCLSGSVESVEINVTVQQ